jgi:hypothetical protein
MRFLPLVLLLLLLLANCSQATLSRINERTFRIEGPPVPGGAEAPNRRLAERACPGGYRLLSSESHKGGPDRAIESFDTITTWTIRCL